MDRIEDFAVNSPRWLSLEDFEGEEWRGVVNFEDYYQVSNYGRVKLLKRFGKNSMIKKAHIQEGKHLAVYIRKGETAVPRYIHVLVAESFGLYHSEKTYVRHKDGDYMNNRVDNLIADIPYSQEVVGDVKTPTQPMIKSLYEKGQRTVATNVTEEWMPVMGYEGYYEVSNFGNIRSLDRTYTNRCGVTKKKKGRLLKLSSDQRGYKICGLYVNGKGKSVRVHRLVALNFIPNPHNLPEINHKDEDKTNNYVGNLEWCDSKYNKNYGTWRKKLSRSQSISNSYATKVVAFDKKDRVIGTFDSIVNASRTLNVSADSISRSCNHTKRFRYVKGLYFRKQKEVGEQEAAL